MKLLNKKGSLINKEITSNTSVKSKLLNKKVLSIVCILIIIGAGFGIYKVKLLKQTQKNQETARYITLSKASISSIISASGAIKSGESTNVYANNSNSKVKVVNVEVGDQVKAGDVIAELDTTSLEQEIEKLEKNLQVSRAKAKAELESKQSNYENALNLYNNNQNGDLLKAQAELNSATAKSEDAKKVYEYNQSMFDNGEISQHDLDQYKMDYDTSKDNYDKAVASLESTKLSVKKSLNDAKNDYDNAKLSYDNNTDNIDLQNKKEDLAKCVITAPVDGVITTVNATVGAVCDGSIVVIQNLSNLIVNVDIDETDISKISVGQKVKIETDATGKEMINGEIVRVDPISSTAASSSSSTSATKSSSTATATSSNSTSSDVTFTAKVQINDQNELIKVGMNAVVNIVLDEKDDVYSVPYESIINNKNGSVVYSAEEQEGKYIVKEVLVTKGIESDVYTQILGDDLKDGMIILSDPSKYQVGSIIEIKKR